MGKVYFAEWKFAENDADIVVEFCHSLWPSASDSKLICSIVLVGLRYVDLVLGLCDPHFLDSRFSNDVLRPNYQRTIHRSRSRLWLCDTTQDYMSRLLGCRRSGNRFLSRTIRVEFFSCLWSCLNSSSPSEKSQ